MAIRRGERSFEEAIAEIDDVERRLAEALEQTTLPPSLIARASTSSSSRPSAEHGGGSS